MDFVKIYNKKLGKARDAAKEYFDISIRPFALEDYKEERNVRQILSDLLHKNDEEADEKLDRAGEAIEPPFLPYKEYNPVAEAREERAREEREQKRQRLEKLRQPFQDICRLLDGPSISNVEEFAKLKRHLKDAPKAIAQAICHLSCDEVEERQLLEPWSIEERARQIVKTMREVLHPEYAEMQLRFERQGLKQHHQFAHNEFKAQIIALGDFLEAAMEINKIFSPPHRGR